MKRFLAMKNSTGLFLIGSAMAVAAGTIAVPTAGTAGAVFGCHPNDSLFAYTVNYPNDARFIAADKNQDGLLCIKSNDPHYNGDPETVVVYDNNLKKG